MLIAVPGFRAQLERRRHSAVAVSSSAEKFRRVELSASQEVEVASAAATAAARCLRRQPSGSEFGSVE